jgi:hypothetical protein
MKSLILILAALLALGGCGSTTEPITTPPDVAGSYRGAVVLFLTAGATTGDTLDAALDLAQSQTTLTGTWRVWSSSGADSVWGTVENGKLVSSGTPAVWQVTGGLRVTRSSCEGAFAVVLDIVSMAPSPGNALQGTFVGSAACFRGAAAQTGELTVVLGATGRPRIRSLR